MPVHYGSQPQEGIDPSLIQNPSFKLGAFDGMIEGHDAANIESAGTPNTMDNTIFADLQQLLDTAALPQEVVLMQQPREPLPTQMPVKGGLVASSSGPPGAHYHPQIGWYYPATAIPPPPPPSAFVPAYGYGPAMSYAPQVSPMYMVPAQHPPHIRAHREVKIPRTDRASEADTDLSSEDGVPMTHSRGKKRKAVSARKSSEGHIQPLVLSDDDGHGEQTFTPKRTRAGSKANVGRKMPSIDQACICGSAEPHIPRPRNRFILYRQMNLLAITKALEHSSDKSQGAISAEAGRRWRAEPPKVQKMYQEMAIREKREHERKYPGYKYMPKRKGMNGIDDRFGGPGCTCGAYERNLKKMREAGYPVDKVMGGAGRTSHVEQENAPHRAPTVEMSSQLQIPQRPYRTHGSIFAEAIEQANQTQAQLAVACTEAPTGFHYFAPGRALPGYSPVPPATTQPIYRSSGHHTSLQDEDFEAYVQSQLTQASTNVPTHFQEPRGPQPGAIMTFNNGPPSMNTRSKSKSHSGDFGDLLQQANIPAAEEPDFDFLNKDLFGENAEALAAGFDFSATVFNFEDFVASAEDSIDVNAGLGGRRVSARIAERRRSSKESEKSSPGRSGSGNKDERSSSVTQPLRRSQRHAGH